MRSLLQGIPSVASLGSVGFDFAKEGSGHLTLPTVSLCSRGRAGPMLLPVQVPHAAGSRAAAGVQLPAFPQVGADPASPDLPAAAPWVLLAARERYLVVWAVVFWRNWRRGGLGLSQT